MKRLLIKLAPLVLSLKVWFWAECSDTDVLCVFQACSAKCLNVFNLPEKTWSDLFISLTWFRVYSKSSSYFCKLDSHCVLPANSVLINWFVGCLLSLWKSSYCILICCVENSREVEPFHTGHREALVFSMHIVSTLLPRLLFHTICIFNVNIFFIYGAICCPCYNNMFGVSFWDCSFLNVSSLRTSLFRV